MQTIHMMPVQGREGPKAAKGPDHWRSVMDNLLIEFLASLFIILSAVMYGPMRKDKEEHVVFADPCEFSFFLVSLFHAFMSARQGGRRSPPSPSLP